MRSLAVALLAGCSFTGPAALGVDANSPNDAGDAGTPSDGTPTGADVNQPDVAVTSLTLSDTPPDVPAQAGAGCVNGTTGAIYDSQWFRVFALSDPHWNVPAGLYVSGVSIAIWKAHAASNVRIQVGTYDGTFPTGTFQLAAFHSLAEIDPSVTDTSTPTLASFAIALDVPAGANLAVKVSSASGLELGATGGPVYQDGFVGSTACSYSPPVSTPSFIVTVTGAPT